MTRLLTLVALACAAKDSTGPAQPSGPAPNYVRLESDPGEYFGLGSPREYTQANSIITVTSYDAAITFQIHGDTHWFGNFQAPGSLAQLQRGVWVGLQAPIGNDRVNGGLYWSGNGSSCSILTGSVAVDSVTYNAGAVSAIDMRFEQRCGGGPLALRGTIHWRSDDTTSPPGPVRPPPAGLWRPPSGATPSSGTYVYIEGEPGEPLAGNRSYLYTASTSTISIQSTERGVGVYIQGTDRWIGNFAPMSNVNPVTTGYYGDAGSWPFHNPTKPGLSIDRISQGFACSQQKGWFVVDKVTWSGAVLTAIDLRFEQRCYGEGPRLRGAIHWELP